MFPPPSVFPQERAQDCSSFHETSLLLPASASQLCSVGGKEEKGVLGARAGALPAAQPGSPPAPSYPSSSPRHTAPRLSPQHFAHTASTCPQPQICRYCLLSVPVQPLHECGAGPKSSFTGESATAANLLKRHREGLEMLSSCSSKS